MMLAGLVPFVPGFARGRLLPGLAPGRGPYIAVVDQAMPAELRFAPDPFLRGIVVRHPAPLSHPLLALRGFGLPVVLLQTDVALPWGEEAWLDAVNGRLATHPLSEPVPPCPAPAPLRTADGVEVTLLASVGSAEAAARAVAHGAAGIGLLRSEYLLPENDAVPDRAFFREALRTVCEAAAGRPVTVRLLDVARDKHPPWVPAWAAVHATLGLQGVRLYGHEPVHSAVLAELEAIGTLAPAFSLRVLLPYVTSRRELERWVGEARRRAPVPVGTMLETPAAALDVGSLLEVADFAVLGCNDLMQCVFAANRDEAAVADRMDFYAPVLFRFLGEILERAPDPGRLQVNGLLTQWPGALTLLLGLGYRRFSVDPALIPWLARRVTETDTAQATALAATACRLRHAAEVRELLGV